MKIPDRKDELTQSEALRELNETRKPKSLSDAAQQKEKGSAQPGAGANEGVNEGVSVELGLSQAISAELDPALFVSEHRARFDEIKKRVQSGTYIMPSSEILAGSLVEEIDLEILSLSPGLEDQKTE